MSSRINDPLTMIKKLLHLCLEATFVKMTKPLQSSWLNILLTIESPLREVCLEPFEQESIAQIEGAAGTLAEQVHLVSVAKNSFTIWLVCGLALPICLSTSFKQVGLDRRTRGRQYTA